jgi:hypothetical protein
MLFSNTKRSLRPLRSDQAGQENDGKRDQQEPRISHETQIIRRGACNVQRIRRSGSGRNSVRISGIYAEVVRWRLQIPADRVYSRMFDRKITRIAVTLLCLSPLWGNVVLAQDEDPQAARIRQAREEAIRQAQAREAEALARRERERADQAMREFLTDTRTLIAAANNTKDRQRAFLSEIQKKQLDDAYRSFQASIQSLTEALLDSKKKLKDPARNMTKSTSVFLEFIKRTSKPPPRFDSSEFKDFTSAQLGWEALTTAERLVPALERVVQAQSESSVDIRFLLSLSKLQAELLRLQWMTGKLR